MAECAVEPRSNMHTKISPQTDIKKTKKKRRTAWLRTGTVFPFQKGETGCGRSDEMAIHPPVMYSLDLVQPIIGS